MNKITNYMKEITARLTGDESAKIAAQNERKANSAVNSQIAAQKGKLVDDETAVEDAEEAYKAAKYPTTRIEDARIYIANLVKAKACLDGAKAAVDATKANIKFFEELLAKEWAEVDD